MRSDECAYSDCVFIGYSGVKMSKKSMRSFYEGVSRYGIRYRNKNMQPSVAAKWIIETADRFQDA